MIVTRTPLRVSFIGGGSDLPDHYKVNGGAVVSASIKQYVYIAVNKRFDDSIRISYSKTEHVDSIDKIEHKLVRAALKKLGIRNGIEITSIADIPSQGTGLGSSSAFIVGLLNALYAYCGEYVSPEKLAAEACEIEIDICKEPIGKQDQYGCALGGINLIRFNKDETVSFNPVSIHKAFEERFQESFLLFYTGITRSASSILKSQIQELRINENKALNVSKMANMTGEFMSAIGESDLPSIGYLLDEAWKLKKSISERISSCIVDDMYTNAMNSGALGGKLLGAGGGGFLLVCAQADKHAEIKNALAGHRCLPFEIDPIGSIILYNSAKTNSEKFRYDY